MSSFKIIIMALILSACSSEPKVQEFSNTADPEAEIQKVVENIKQAESDNIPILSPTSYASAVSSKEEAVTTRTNNGSQKKILHSIAVAQSYLDKAITNANVSGQILNAALAARQDSMKEKAEQLFPNEFKELDKDFKKYATKIENNDTSDAIQAKTELEKKYRELELNAIRYNALGEANKNIQLAIKEGAKKITPQTLTATEKQYLESDSIIKKDKYNLESVQSAGAAATKSSILLLKMVRTAKGSAIMNPEELAKRSVKQEQEIDSSGKNIEKLSSDVSESESRNTKMQSALLLNKQYDMARNEFTKEEAEIYKQGNNLVLRLKTLNFPNNGSTIPESNYALLTKVQKVISETMPAQVAVEGHTDSVGSKSANQKLSLKRAQSVQSYLVANGSVENDKVTAYGLGDTKPLTSNKTASGRTKNRRVDVIIKSVPSNQ